MRLDNGVMAESGAWDAGDGTRWIYSRGLNIWTGWEVGEDGVWTFTPEEFARLYPEAPDPAQDDGGGNG